MHVISTCRCFDRLRIQLALLHPADFETRLSSHLDLRLADAAYEDQSDLKFCGAGGKSYADTASLITGSPAYVGSGNAGSGSVTITLVN